MTAVAAAGSASVAVSPRFYSPRTGGTVRGARSHSRTGPMTVVHDQRTVFLSQVSSSPRVGKWHTIE